MERTFSDESYGPGSQDNLAPVTLEDIEWKVGFKDTPRFDTHVEKLDAAAGRLTEICKSLLECCTQYRYANEHKREGVSFILIYFCCLGKTRTIWSENLAFYVKETQRKRKAEGREI